MDNNKKYMIKTVKKYKYELFLTCDFKVYQLIDWCEDEWDYFFICMDRESNLVYIHILQITVPLKKKLDKWSYSRLMWIWNHNVLKSPTYEE